MLIIPPLMLLLVSIIFGLVFFIYASGDGSVIPSYFKAYMPMILMVNHKNEVMCFCENLIGFGWKERMILVYGNYKESVDWP